MRTLKKEKYRTLIRSYSIELNECLDLGELCILTLKYVEGYGSSDNLGGQHSSALAVKYFFSGLVLSFISLGFEYWYYKDKQPESAANEVSAMVITHIFFSFFILVSIRRLYAVQLLRLFSL